jgi:hypothetical protein
LVSWFTFIPCKMYFLGCEGMVLTAC